MNERTEQKNPRQTLNAFAQPNAISHRMRTFHRKKFTRFNVTRYRCVIKPVKIQKASTETGSFFFQWYSIFGIVGSISIKWSTFTFDTVKQLGWYEFFSEFFSVHNFVMETERCNQKAGGKKAFWANPQKLFIQRLMLYFLCSLSPRDKVNTKVLNWIFKIRSNFAHFVYLKIKLQHIHFENYFSKKEATEKQKFNVSR